MFGLISLTGGGGVGDGVGVGSAVGSGVGLGVGGVIMPPAGGVGVGVGVAVGTWFCVHTAGNVMLPVTVMASICAAVTVWPLCDHPANVKPGRVGLVAGIAPKLIVVFCWRCTVGFVVSPFILPPFRSKVIVWFGGVGT